MVSRRDALRELPKVLSLKNREQLRLPDQNYLKQLFFGRLKVRQ